MGDIIRLNLKIKEKFNKTILYKDLKKCKGIIEIIQRYYRENFIAKGTFDVVKKSKQRWIDKYDKIKKENSALRHSCEQLGMKLKEDDKDGD